MGKHPISPNDIFLATSAVRRSTLTLSPALRAQALARIPEDLIAASSVGPVALVPLAEFEPVFDTQGTITGIPKRASVFRQLAQGRHPQITANQAAHGQKLIEIFATWQGAAGSDEDSEPGIQRGRSDPELSNDRRLQARDEFERIMRFVGPSSAKLLAAICEDWINGDGRPLAREASTVETVVTRLPAVRGGSPVELVSEREVLGRPMLRWRKVVERVTRDKDRNRQSVYVVVAARDLEMWFN